MRQFYGQSFKCGQYNASFIGKPILRDYETKKNQRYIEITKYVNQKNGEIIPPGQFKLLDKKLQEDYDEQLFYIKVLTASVEGVNSRPFCIINLRRVPD